MYALLWHYLTVVGLLRLILKMKGNLWIKKNINGKVFWSGNTEEVSKVTGENDNLYQKLDVLFSANTADSYSMGVWWEWIWTNRLGTFFFVKKKIKINYLVLTGQIRINSTKQNYKFIISRLDACPDKI